MYMQMVTVIKSDYRSNDCLYRPSSLPKSLNNFSALSEQALEENTAFPPLLKGMKILEGTIHHRTIEESDEDFPDW